MSEAPASQTFLDHSVRLAQIANPQSEIVHFGADQALPLDCGDKLAPFSIAYQTYGTLNADKSNLVLVCHALTGDQHVANVHPVTGKPGWWEIMVGPGKPIDTDRYFVLCPNVIGGCMGSTGPSSINPATGQRLRARLSRSSPSPTWCGRRRSCSIISAFPTCSACSAARWAACRCWNGRRPIRTACSRRCRSPARRATPRRTSPSTRSGARRSWPILIGARGAISMKARARAKGSPSPAWPRTSPICPTMRCTPSSAATCRTATRSPSASTRTSRSRAICAIRA